MDVSHQQHDRARRQTRTAHVDHPVLAPLTARLPLDDESFALGGRTSRSRSYLHGKSAPTTPRLLSRSPGPHSRSYQRLPSLPGDLVSGSKSACQLSNIRKKPISGAATPRSWRDDGLGTDPRSGHTADNDWLFRAGALMSSEARESKGQTWLTSRQSSASLTSLHDAEEEAFEMELSRERDMTSRLVSRRGSFAAANSGTTPNESRMPSQLHSRSHSPVEMRSHLPMPPDCLWRGEEPCFSETQQSIGPGPDFVNIDKKLEGLELASVRDDEVAVRKLVRRGQPSKTFLIGSLIRWPIFSDNESEEDSDSDYDEHNGDKGAKEDLLSADGSTISARDSERSRRFRQGMIKASLEQVPPPAVDGGGWRDAAWLLSVAAKILF